MAGSKNKFGLGAIIGVVLATVIAMTLGLLASGGVTSPGKGFFFAACLAVVSTLVFRNAKAVLVAVVTALVMYFMVAPQVAALVH